MKTTKILTILVLAFGLILCWARVSKAEPMGTAFTYQGHLMDKKKPADGLYDLRFKLYDANSDGNQVGSDVQEDDVDVIDGYFTLELDFGGDVFDGNAVWLETGVRPGELEDPNVYTILEPRLELTPVPYALQTRGIFVDDACNVGIGTTSPSEKLEVAGTVTATTFVGDGSGLTGITITETDPTVIASVKDGVSWSEVSSRPAGLDDGDDVGITSESDPQVGINTTNYIPKWNGSALISGTIYDNGNVGIGTTSPGAKLSITMPGAPIGFPPLDVGGLVITQPGHGNTGDIFRVRTKYILPEPPPPFIINSAGKVGIGTGNPLSKLSVGGDGFADTGVYGEGSTYGVYGKNGSSGNYGYIGGSSFGVRGFHSSGSYGYLGGASYGVRGKHDISGNYGYIGSASYGVKGTHSSGNYGYLGGASYGVRGKHDSTGNYGYLGSRDKGVYGKATNIGYWAGYFSGNVTVTKTLSVAAIVCPAKFFRIDHPLDPENKYLNHASIESSEMMNVYSGNVVLDKNGEAEVQLPEWSEPLNTDFRYQLTCIGGFAQVYIAEEISNNRFKIAGGTPAMKVSWQVAGVRHDPHAEANPLEVEEDKAPEERGYYVYPEGYGYGQEKSISSLHDSEPIEQFEEPESEVTDETNRQ